MNEYIQDTIKELLRLLDVRIVDTSANYKKMEELYSEDLKNALQDAYNRGVEDSLAKVSKKNPRNHYCDEYDYLHDERHIVIDETIDNISKLTTNK